MYSGNDERQIDGSFSRRKNMKLIKIIRNNMHKTQVFKNEAKATKGYQEMHTFLVYNYRNPYIWSRVKVKEYDY